MVGDLIDWFSFRQGVAAIALAPLVIFQLVIGLALVIDKSRSSNRLLLLAIDLQACVFWAYGGWVVVYAIVYVYTLGEPWSVFVRMALRGWHDC